MTQWSEKGCFRPKIRSHISNFQSLFWPKCTWNMAIFSTFTMHALEYPKLVAAYRACGRPYPPLLISSISNRPDEINWQKWLIFGKFWPGLMKKYENFGFAKILHRGDPYQHNKKSAGYAGLMRRGGWTRACMLTLGLIDINITKNLESWLEFEHRGFSSPKNVIFQKKFDWNLTV